jgi:hypothetical protein
MRSFPARRDDAGTGQWAREQTPEDSPKHERQTLRLSDTPLEPPRAWMDGFPRLL